MKILMVCLGNICRSPLAEGIMQHLIWKKNLDWKVDSAGMGNWHIGRSPDKRSIKVALEYGIDISKQVCRLFELDDFDRFDHILVMDGNNLNDVLLLARNEKDVKKVHLLLEDKIIPDPYHNDALFEGVFKMVEQGCNNFIKKHHSPFQEQ